MIRGVKRIMDEIELIKARMDVRFERAYDEDWYRHSGYVYTYTDLADNIVKYVGQTIHMEQRYKEHLSQKEFSTRRWLVKYMAIDPYCISAKEKDLRDKMLDIEYLFIKHYGTMQYFNSERTFPRKNYEKYSHILDKDLDKEFKVFVNESAKEEYSNLEFSNIAKSRLRSMLPDLQMVADIITSQNVQEISSRLEKEYTGRIDELQETIRILKKENGSLKKKISSASKLLA